MRDNILMMLLGGLFGDGVGYSTPEYIPHHIHIRKKEPKKDYAEVGDYEAMLRKRTRSKKIKNRGKARRKRRGF